MNWLLQPVFADVTLLRATGFVHWKWRHTGYVENTGSALYFLINSHFPATMMDGRLRSDEWNWDSQWNRALKSCQNAAKVNKKETDISEQTAFPLFKTRSLSCKLSSRVRIHPSWDRRQPVQQRQLIDVKRQTTRRQIHLQKTALRNILKNGHTSYSHRCQQEAQFRNRKAFR